MRRVLGRRLRRPGCGRPGKRAGRADASTLATAQVRRRTSRQSQRHGGRHSPRRSSRRPAGVLSVVSITVDSRRRAAPQRRRIFFLPQGQEQTVQSFATGFVIRPDGTILTSQHVVAGEPSW